MATVLEEDETSLTLDSVFIGSMENGLNLLGKKLEFKLDMGMKVTAISNKE